MIKNGLNQIYGCVKMWGLDDLRTKKKGLTGSKIKEKTDTKCFKTVKMTDFHEQCYIQAKKKGPISVK